MPQTQSKPLTDTGTDTADRDRSMPAEPTTDSDRTLPLVDVVEPFAMNNGVRWSSAAAAEAAHLDAYQSLVFERHPDTDALVAVGTETAIDGRRQDIFAVRLRDRGNHSLPKQLLDQLGTDFDAVEAGDAPRLAVYASEGVLVFQPATATCEVPAATIASARDSQ